MIKYHKGDGNRANNRWLWNPNLIFVYNSRPIGSLFHDKMQACVCNEVVKLGFIVVVAKFDNEGNNRKAFVVMGC
jgi:hypothetical protein